jgi:hypothetical protein
MKPMQKGKSSLRTKYKNRKILQLSLIKELSDTRAKLKTSRTHYKAKTVKTEV